MTRNATSCELKTILVTNNNKYSINMHKLGLLAISFILIFMIVPIAVAESDVSVGVKQGD